MIQQKTKVIVVDSATTSDSRREKENTSLINNNSSNSSSSSKANQQFEWNKENMKRTAILVFDLVALIAFVVLTVLWQKAMLENWVWGICCLAFVIILVVGYFLWPTTEIERKT